MPSLIGWTITVDANETSQTFLGSYAITGGINDFSFASSYGIRPHLNALINAFDIRYSFRVAFSADDASVGAGDFHFGVAIVAPSIDTTSSYVPGSAVTDAVDGSLLIDGRLFYNSTQGTFEILGQVITINQGSFAITVVAQETGAVVGSFVISTQDLFALKDASGSYGMYAVIEGVIIKVDIIDDAIKQILISAGVKFL